MKCKKLLSFILVCLLLCFMVVGCTSETDEKGYKDITDLYTSTQNEDNTHSFSFADLNGNILFEKENVVREPKINMVSVSVYELITQTGTGLSTNWAVYCDVENSKVSETFQYVLGAQGEYVFFADFNDGVHSLVVQNIFDSNIYQKTYTLKDCSSFADPIVGFSFEGNGKAIISYVTGSETMIAQTSATIYFP